MKKKFLLIAIALCICLIYFFINLHIDGKKFNTISLIGNFLPNEIKKNIKEKIFIFAEYKKIKIELDNVKIKLARLENDINYLVFIKSDKEDLINKKYKITKYYNNILNDYSSRAYFQIYKDDIFLVTGNGLLFKMKITEVNNDIFLMKKINTNFLEFYGQQYKKDLKDNKLDLWQKQIVKGILIDDNNFYISYSKEIALNCYVNSILKAKLNDKIVFEDFFSVNECQPDYANGQTGGNLAHYKDNKILFTIGDWESYERKNENDNPQNINSLIGKIISIEKNTKKIKILSMGHRNPQGLFYDKENDVIFSTEHGPKGGDEININIHPEETSKIKNYGWGISSYGEHYDNIPKSKYKIAPLHKSHTNYGFYEPLKYFKNSVGITQIIKTEKFENIKNKNVIYTSTMGYVGSEGQWSIHKFVLSKNFVNIENHEVIKIGNRIRDLIYIEKLNKIIMFLDMNGSIALMENR